MKFSKKVRFVEIINKSEETITIYPNWPKTKNGKPKTRSPEVILPPGGTSRPLPYDIFIKCKDFEVLVKESKISMEDVNVEPPFVTIKNQSSEEFSFELRLPEKPKKKSNENGEPPDNKNIINVKIPPGLTSTPLHFNSIIDKSDIESRDSIIVEPVSYIGPPISDSTDFKIIGSLGYEDVYACWECGEPIVFRYRPPIPIHI